MLINLSSPNTIVMISCSGKVDNTCGGCCYSFHCWTTADEMLYFIAEKGIIIRYEKLIKSGKDNIENLLHLKESISMKVLSIQIKTKTGWKLKYGTYE